ncbi:hypothetical protein [Sulfurimonas sp.]|uniref:hypothetical protein n=1 Tax=Sulfurimonas sp. TaxID=2022749 RepID=UPI002B4A2392|nr:hypothetical protein [Sulfurimonas sp.]
MAATILIINGSLSKFFTKDADGNIIELKEGDTIEENAVIYGDKSNSASASIEIIMNNGAGNIVLSGAQEQVFNSSVTGEASIEGNIAKKSFRELDDEIYSNDKEADKEKYLGIFDETAAGEKQARQNEGGVSVFEYRDANSTHAVSGLLDTPFNDEVNKNIYVDHGTDGDNVLVSNSGYERRMNDAGLEMRTEDGSDTYIELDVLIRETSSNTDGNSNTGEHLSSPEADEVTTTSNINSDDYALNTLLSAFFNDAEKPDISDIAFFKKFDVGGGLDGSSVENDFSDPADLGGVDAQSLENSLSYEITKLASTNSYGDLYLEQNGSFTKITDANMQTMSFGNGDNVYWIVTHEQVPTTGDATSLGGADDFGSVQSVTDSWSGVSLKAIGLNGDESVVTYNAKSGIGIAGAAGGKNNQIGYDAKSENTERIIVDFASTVTSAKIGITHLYNNHIESEVGIVDAYLDGNKVGSFTFSKNIGDNNFAPDFVLSTENIGSENSGAVQAGYFNIEGLAFDQLQFSASFNVHQHGFGDSSDYFLASIDVKEVVDAQYQYKVTDESGLESDAVDVVINVDTSTPMHQNEIQTVNNFDTVILEDGIKLDFSDDNLERIKNVEGIQMNGNAEITHISLEDIFDITESVNSLIITGNDTNNFDASDLNESGDWIQTSMVDNGDNTTFSYSHSDGYRVELTIDEEIITTGM